MMGEICQLFSRKINYPVDKPGGMVYNISTDRESATDDAPDLLIKEMTAKFARLGGYFFLFSASDMIA